MARMIGMSGGRRFTCGCCDWSKGKRGVKADEDRLWQTEADEEINFTDIARHIGAGGYCCMACRDEYTGALGTAEDLEGIEGVTFGESR